MCDAQVILSSGVKPEGQVAPKVVRGFALRTSCSVYCVQWEAVMSGEDESIAEVNESVNLKSALWDLFVTTHLKAHNSRLIGTSHPKGG